MRPAVSTKTTYGTKNERKSVVSLSIVLLLLFLPHLLELCTEDLVLAFQPLELLVEVVAGITLAPLQVIIVPT